MDKNKIIEAVKSLSKDAKKRNFVQNYDMVVTLRGLDLKKPEQKVDFFVTLHNNKGKKVKIGAFVGPELKEDAGKVFDTVITEEDFDTYNDLKVMKKLADEHAFFIAQANVMGKVAGKFGKVLGTRGKMPNPKAGAVIPPKGANLEAVYEKFQKTVRVLTKNGLMIQCTVGNEDTPAEELATNVFDVFNQLVHHLPAQENNIKKAFLKLTMSKPVEIEK